MKRKLVPILFCFLLIPFFMSSLNMISEKSICDVVAYTPIKPISGLGWNYTTYYYTYNFDDGTSQGWNKSDRGGKCWDYPYQQSVLGNEYHSSPYSCPLNNDMGGDPNETWGSFIDFNGFTHIVSFNITFWLRTSSANTYKTVQISPCTGVGYDSKEKYFSAGSWIFTSYSNATFPSCQGWTTLRVIFGWGYQHTINTNWYDDINIYIVDREQVEYPDLNISSDYNGREIHAPFSMINRTYGSELLYVDGASLSINQISKNGSSPYLDALDDEVNCLYTASTSVLYDQYYTFEDTNITMVTDAKLWIRMQQPDGAPIYARAYMYLWDGSSYVTLMYFERSGTWLNGSQNILSYGFSTPSKINNARLKIGLMVSHEGGYVAYVTAVWLEVFGFEITDSVEYEAPQSFEYTEETTVTLEAENSFKGYVFNHWLVGVTEYEDEIINVTISGSSLNAVIYYDSEAYLISDWVKARFPFFLGLAGYFMMCVGTIMTIKELKIDHDIQKALVWILIIVPIGFALICMWLFG